MKPFTLFLALFISLATAGLGQAPPGYYNSTSGLYGSSLKSALHQIIDNHNAVAYNTLHFYFKSTDARPDSTVWDMYSDVPGGTPPYIYHFIAQDQCGNYSQEGDCYNREHSFPKSWFGGEVMPMYSDLFHLYPTDGYVNGQRGNLPYGQVQSSSWTSMNGSKRGTSAVSGYAGAVFEPIDAYKGDLARTMFYMATRYYGQDAAWPGSDMTNGAEPKPWALAMLRSWHQQDPVSQKEIDRNNAVFAIQSNRNPFIDFPHFVEDIWSPTAGIPSYTFSIMACYPNPAENFVTLDFSQNLHQGTVLQVLSPSYGIVRQYPLPFEASRYQLNVSDLAAGMYAIRIMSENLSLSNHAKVLIVR